MIESLQTQIDVDEADDDYIPLIQQETNLSNKNSLNDEISVKESEEPEQKQMTEEELLKAIEDNLNDKKTLGVIFNLGLRKNGDTDLVGRIKSFNPDVDLRVIKKAYNFGKLMHGEQLRESGDPYFSHPVEVTNILAELNLDTSSLVCALLHDTIEDTKATIKDIRKILEKKLLHLLMVLQS